MSDFLQSIIDRDPAAKLDKFNFNLPRVKAIFFVRLPLFAIAKFDLVARVSIFTVFNRIEIHPKAKIGKNYLLTMEWEL